MKTENSYLWLQNMYRIYSRTLFIYLLVMMLYSFQQCITQKSKEIKYVEGVTGEMLALPCFVTPPPGDKVALILWYRNLQPEAVFTYDTRQGSEELQQVGPLKGRASFHMGRSPHMNLRRLSLSDAGIYECRVDFVKAPSRTTILKVVVIEPPTSLTIEDTMGKTVSFTLTLTEGESLQLLCFVSGGVPRPQIRWTLDGLEIDNSYEEVDQELSQNEITFPVLERHHHKSKLACHALNSNITNPLKQEVTLLLNVPPLEVHVSDVPEELHSGRTYKALCTVIGSRPAPFIVWKLTPVGGKPKILLKVDLTPRNQSQVWLEFKVDYTLHRAILSCEAYSPALPDAIIFNSTSLNIVFAPKLSLALGEPLKSSYIKEGMDVYFKCSILANPDVQSVKWFKNHQEVKHNITKGVVASREYLVLQSITREWSGDYSCKASNKIGAATSNSLKIPVLHAPVCARPGAIMRVSLGQEVSVPCVVMANPSNVTFSWTFSHSTNQNLNMTEENISGSGFESNLSYRPEKNEDYGSLRCYARNAIGKQKVACRIIIKSAGSPLAPVNCTVSNQTWDSLEVTCGGNQAYYKHSIDGKHEPLQGGTPLTFPGAKKEKGVTLLSLDLEDQEETEEDFAELAIDSDQPKYLLTVRERVSRELVYNLTGVNKVFSVSGLTPGLDYVISISRFNSHGRSAVVNLEALTLRTAENRMREQDHRGDTAILGAFAGALGLLILLGLAIVLFTLYGKSSRLAQEDTAVYRNTSVGQTTNSGEYALDKSSRETNVLNEESLLLDHQSTPSSSSRTRIYSENEKSNPDIIETNTGEANMHHRIVYNSGQPQNFERRTSFSRENSNFSTGCSITLKTVPESSVFPPVPSSSSSNSYTRGNITSSLLGSQHISSTSVAFTKDRFIRVEGEPHRDRESFL